MGSRANDSEWLVETARQLSQAARDVDRTVETLPAELDAGPFTELVIDQIEAVCANTAALILRLDDAATNCREESGRYSASELEGLRTIKKTDERLDQLDGHVPIWEQESDSKEEVPKWDPPGK